MTTPKIRGNPCTVNQPCLFPRLHIMNRAARVKTFLVLSSAQFMRKSDQALLWVTLRGVPTSIRIPTTSGRVPLREKFVQLDERAMGKILRRIKSEWPKTADAEGALALLEVELRATNGRSMAQCGLHSMRHRSNILGLTGTTFVDDVDVAPPIPGDPSGWMLDQCLNIGASSYYAGGTAINAYIDHDKWKRRGVRLLEQDWKVPKEIVDLLGHEVSTSVLDVIAHGGLDALRRELASHP